MSLTQFASLLKQKRTTLKLSQSKVAELCYLSKSSYNHYENGNRLPTLETLFLLSNVLETDVNELILAIVYDTDVTDENKSQASSHKLKEASPSENKRQDGFIIGFNLLNQEEQQAIIDIIDSLLSAKTSDTK